MKTKILRAGLGLLVLLAVGLVLRAVLAGGGAPAAAGKLKVTASFYPMAEFARQVGGDRVEVSTLVRPGVEPHDYDPTPQDIAGIYRSRVFIYNGAALELWADKIRDGLAANGIVVVRASDGIDLMAAGGGSGGSAYDPHVWLDPVLAQRQVDNIRDGLIKADPGHRSTYEQNARAYDQKLADLNDAFANGLSNCGRRDIVTSHQAFKYLAARYHLDAVALSGLSPEEEPSPQKLAEVSNFARQHNIHYIFFEKLVNPKLSETIAREVGAQTLVFDPLEGLTQDEINRGMDYISVQQQNLKNLRLALNCR